MTNNYNKRQNKNKTKKDLKASRLKRLEDQLKANIAKRKKVKNKNG